MKKTERIYTKLDSISQLVSLIGTRGDRPVFKYFRDGMYCSLSYEEFYEMIMNEAAGFEAAGIAGKRIAVIGETSPEWVATYLAVLVSGGVIVPMDKELDVTEIEKFLAWVNAEGIVFSAEFNEKFADTVKKHKTIKKFIPLEPMEIKSRKILDFNELISSGEKLRAKKKYAPAKRVPTDLAVMLFTSGTTGTSKCVMLSEKNVTSAINACCETVEFFPSDTIVSVLPLHHTYELACMLSAINYGFDLIGINDSLKHLMRNFAEFKPTGLVLVPMVVNAMYKKIRAEVNKQGKDFQFNTAMLLSNGLRHVGIDVSRKLFKSVLAPFGGRLVKIISGGAPLDPEMIKNFAAFGIQICEGYGITECSPLVSVNPYYAPRPGSVGTTVPCCKTRIEVTGKNDLGYNEGEIQVLGDNVMMGYFDNEEENRKAFTADGWFRTGDVGYIDEDGYIYITGRIKSVIVLDNGKNVFPEEIEEYLAKIPEIAESVVVGRKSEENGSVNLVAVVYPNAEAFADPNDRQTVYKTIYKKISALNKKLPTFKVIRAIEIREEPFEKTTSRKIKRHLVK